MGMLDCSSASRHYIEMAKECSVSTCSAKSSAHGWCQMHYLRWQTSGSVHAEIPNLRQPAAIRFWTKVKFTETCWLWQGSIAKNRGYGTFRKAHLVSVKAHRFAYEFCVGPIPEGLQIDHLCRVRNCVNPDHLEAVSPRENMRRGVSPAANHARKTHCIRGHEFTPENTRLYSRKRGLERVCRACKRNERRRAAS